MGDCGFGRTLERERRSRSGAAARPGIGVEVATVAGRRHEARPDHEIAEAFAALAVCRISGEQRIECAYDAGVIEVFGIKLGEARAVEGGAEIKIVTARPFAEEPYLRQVGAGGNDPKTRH